MRFVSVFLLLFILNFSKDTQAQTAPPCNLNKGYIWYGQLELNDSISLPFYFKFEKTNTAFQIKIYNAQEIINVDEVKVTEDSVMINMPVFNSEFRCKWQSSIEHHDSLQGFWINHNRNDKNCIRFKANRIQLYSIFPCQCQAFEGKWEVTFSENTADSYKAIGIFNNSFCADLMYGTFLTETGDYRYLSGSVNKYFEPNSDSILTLSCFDGTHAFYFKAIKQKDGTLKGNFYSGSHHYETWSAVRNDKFKLRNPDSLTYIISSKEKIEFRYINTEGKYISINDLKYKGKVIVIQLMGSWCPNCMDESVMFEELYQTYNPQGLEILALAFEKTTDTALARARVSRFKERLHCHYDFLITGKSGKDEALAVFPTLNKIMAFPTTIYIDKQGNIRKIYTGFNGPGTGEYYIKSKSETKVFIEKLLSE
jgi:thiol-disulfide isomerase/thioredoxin